MTAIETFFYITGIIFWGGVGIVVLCWLLLIALSFTLPDDENKYS